MIGRGELLPVYQEHDPLVPINGYEPPDVAGDGDSYSDTRSATRDAGSLSVEQAIDEIFGQGYSDNCRYNSGARKLRDQSVKAEDNRIRQEAQKKRMILKLYDRNQIRSLTMRYRDWR